MKKNKNSNNNNNNKFKQYFDNDHYQNGLRVVIICALAVILAAGVNLLSGLLPTSVANIDLTAEKFFSVSDETREQMAAVNQPVTVYYVCEAGAEYHNTEVLLNLYADASSQITVEKIDPAFNPGFLIQYTGDNKLTNNSLIVVSGDRRQIINYSDYYTSGVFVLEDYLNSAVEYVTSDELKVVYTLTGHDEEKLHTSTIAYMGLDGFSCEELNLIDAGAVPADARAVIINGIRNDITAKEAELLIGYLKQGGNVLLVTDYTTSVLENLTEVTGYFGASTGAGLIMESDSARYTDENPAYIFPNIYTEEYVITKGINYMLLPNMKPIVVEESLDSSIEVTPLLGTSESSVAAHNNIFTGETVTAEGPFTVAASFEKNDGEEGSMIWIASKYVSDVSVSEAVGGGNITFFLNSVCWLGEDEPVESIHGKKISTQYLVIPQNHLNIWMILIIGVIPAAVLLLGAFVCIRRKRR